MNITLSKDGAQIFSAQQAWLDYCEENNIKNPWISLDHLYNEYIHYHHNDDNSTTIIIDDMTDEQKNKEKELKQYRDEYIEMRRLWEGKYILENFGYNTLSIFAEISSAGQSGPPSDFALWFNSIHPCDGFNGKCNLFCDNFNNCERKS